MHPERKNWLDYYQNHYLESVATLFAQNHNIPFIFIKESFVDSKHIDNKRERKKILKTIYHNYYKEHPFFNNFYRTSTILRKNIITSSTLSYYFNLDNFNNYSEVLNTIDIFNEAGKVGENMPNSYLELKEINKIMASKRVPPKLKYPEFFNYTKDCLEDFYLEPVKKTKEVHELSIKYRNCWVDSMSYLIKKHDFFLINLNDKENNLIGTLRYLKDSKNIIHLSGWINPERVKGNEKHYQFSTELLKNISEKIYNASKDEQFNPENISIKLHYGDNKKIIYDLSPWLPTFKQDSIGSLLKKKAESLEANKKNQKKIKINNF